MKTSADETRLRAQLAACAIAAQGGKVPTNERDYAWSPSLLLVIAQKTELERLRVENSALAARNGELTAQLAKKLDRVVSPTDAMLARAVLTLTRVVERQGKERARGR